MPLLRRIKPVEELVAVGAKAGAFGTRVVHDVDDTPIAVRCNQPILLGAAAAAHRRCGVENESEPIGRLPHPLSL